MNIYLMWIGILTKSFGTVENINNAFEALNYILIQKTWPLDYKIVDKTLYELSSEDCKYLQSQGIDLETWPKDKPFMVPARQGYAAYLKLIQDFIANSFLEECGYELLASEREFVIENLQHFIPNAIQDRQTYTIYASLLAEG